MSFIFNIFTYCSVDRSSHLEFNHGAIDNFWEQVEFHLGLDRFLGLRNTDIGVHYDFNALFQKTSTLPIQMNLCDSAC